MADVTEAVGRPTARAALCDGRYPDGPGPHKGDHARVLQLIALGCTCWIAPESCSAQLRDDLAAVPVLNAPTVTTPRMAAPQPVPELSPGSSEPPTCLLELLTQ